MQIKSTQRLFIIATPLVASLFHPISSLFLSRWFFPHLSLSLSIFIFCGSAVATFGGYINNKMQADEPDPDDDNLELI